MQEFAERLKGLRKSKGITQKELAEKLKITKGMVSAYENSVRFPSHITLVRIALFFNVTTDYLYCIDKRDAVHPVNTSDEFNLLMSQIINYTKSKKNDDQQFFD